jgi:hypothetical protein
MKGNTMTNATQDTFEANDSTVTINGRTYTHRTRDGRYARIICDDRFVDGAKYPVIALVLHEGHDYSECYTKDLKKSTGTIASSSDLFKGAKPSLPKTDWTKVAVDTPIWVREEYMEKWVPRHFAKYANGFVYAFKDGRTSHSKCPANTLGTSESAWDKATLTNPNT